METQIPFSPSDWIVVMVHAPKTMATPCGCTNEQLGILFFEHERVWKGENQWLIKNSSMDYILWMQSSRPWFWWVLKLKICNEMATYLSTKHESDRCSLEYFILTIMARNCSQCKFVVIFHPGVWLGRSPSWVTRVSISTGQSTWSDSSNSPNLLKYWVRLNWKNQDELNQVLMDLSIEVAWKGLVITCLLEKNSIDLPQLIKWRVLTWHLRFTIVYLIIKPSVHGPGQALSKHGHCTY